MPLQTSGIGYLPSFLPSLEFSWSSGWAFSFKEQKQGLNAYERYRAHFHLFFCAQFNWEKILLKDQLTAGTLTLTLTLTVTQANLNYPPLSSSKWWVDYGTASQSSRKQTSSLPTKRWSPFPSWPSQRAGSLQITPLLQLHCLLLCTPSGPLAVAGVLVYLFLSPGNSVYPLYWLSLPPPLNSMLLRYLTLLNSILFYSITLSMYFYIPLNMFIYSA